ERLDAAGRFQRRGAPGEVAQIDVERIRYLKRRSELPAGRPLGGGLVQRREINPPRRGERAPHGPWGGPFFRGSRRSASAWLARRPLRGRPGQSARPAPRRAARASAAGGRAATVVPAGGRSPRNCHSEGSKEAGPGGRGRAGSARSRRRR